MTTVNWSCAPTTGAPERLAVADIVTPERFSSSQSAGCQKTLRAIANGGSIYCAAAAFVDLSPGTARDAAHALADHGILRRAASRFEVTDPLLSDWLRQRFTSSP